MSTPRTLTGAEYIAELLADRATDRETRRFLTELQKITRYFDLSACDNAEVAAFVGLAAQEVWGRRLTHPRNAFLAGAVERGVISARAAVAAGANPLDVSPDRAFLLEYLKGRTNTEVAALRLLAQFAIRLGVAPTALSSRDRRRLADWIRGRRPRAARRVLRSIERALDGAPGRHSDTLPPSELPATRNAAPRLGAGAYTLDLIVHTLTHPIGEDLLEPLEFRLAAALFARHGRWWSLDDLARHLRGDSGTDPARWVEHHLRRLVARTKGRLPIERREGHVRIVWKSPESAHRGPETLPLGDRGLEVDLCRLELVETASGQRHPAPRACFELLARVALDGFVDLDGTLAEAAVRRSNRYLAETGTATRLIVRERRIVLAPTDPPLPSVSCGPLRLELVDQRLRDVSGTHGRVLAQLSLGEVAVLATLMRHPGRTFTSAEVSYQLYGHRRSGSVTRTLQSLNRRVAVEHPHQRWGVAEPAAAARGTSSTPRYLPYPRHGFVLDVDRGRIEALTADPGPGEPLASRQLRIVFLLAEAPGARLPRAQLYARERGGRTLAQELAGLTARLRRVAPVRIADDGAHVWLEAVEPSSEVG